MNPAKSHAAPHHPAKKNPYKLGWVQSLSLYPSLAVLFLTGIYLGNAELDGEPLDMWMLHLHGYAVPVFLASFGALCAKHVPVSWKARRNRTSGAVMVAWSVVLASTGALLYYAGGEGVRAASRFIHYWVGLFLLGFLPWHVVAGLLDRRKREKKRKPH